MQQSEFKHFHQLDVRWADQDILGHVNNVQLLRYLECGRVAYCSEVLSLNFVPQLNSGWILADLHCTFISQLHFPGMVTVATRFSKLGNSSANLEAAIFQNLNAPSVVSSEAVLVWFDYVEQTSVRIPNEIRQKIMQYEQISST